MLLAAPFPMMLAWGPELIQIYNDGYRDILGAKHPRALGQPVKACWCEVWEDIAPLFERVRGGQSVEMENLPLTVERGRAPEEAFFTFSYSPIRDADGAVAGVLDVVFETTQDVHARRVEEQLYNELELERSRLKFVFQRAPAVLAFVRCSSRSASTMSSSARISVSSRRTNSWPSATWSPSLTRRAATMPPSFC
jgi:hypothetical protein